MKNTAKATLGRNHAKSRLKTKATTGLPRKPAIKRATAKQGKARKSKRSIRAGRKLVTFAAERGIELNADQTRLFEALDAFLASPNERCFLLKGSAGTGKTYLLKPLTRFIKAKLKRPVALAAPTGRAALVLQRATGLQATTIHRLVYSLEGVAERATSEKASRRSPVFYYPIKKLASDNTNPVFIVDEASMISDTENKSEFFRWGSGRLLNDLLDFARIRDPLFKTKVIFVGDPCQLAPVDGKMSYALSREYLEGDEFTTGVERDAGPDARQAARRLACTEYELTQVERQRGGDILETATELRETILSGKPDHLEVTTRNGQITHDSIEGICEKTCESFRANPSDGIIVTYANKSAFSLNMSVRQLLWGDERALCAGDRLLAYQNNKHLTNGEQIIVTKVFPLDPHTIEVRSARGDAVQLLRFRKIRYRREDGFRTRKPRIEETMILEDFLYWPERELTPDIFSAIYEDFRKRFAAAYPGMRLGSTFMPRAFVSAMSSDPYVTCSKVKFGYAMTCHKAQGGQWDHACVVSDRNDSDRSIEFLRWVYTAVTRARKTLSICGLQEYSPVTALLPMFKPRGLVEASPESSLSRRYLDTLFQEELRDMGASVLTCSVVGVATAGHKAYKYEIGDGTERCVLVFSENKDGKIRKYHFERRSENLGNLIEAMLKRYGACA